VGGGSSPSSTRNSASWWRSRSLIETRHQRLSGSDHRGGGQLERGLLILKAWDDLRAPALFLEAVLGEVRGPHPDTVTNRDPMDGKGDLPVLFEAGDSRRESSAISIREELCSRSRGIEGGGVAHRIEVCQDLSGLVIGELGPDVGQAVKPVADLHRGGEDRLDRPDQPRSTV